jgi:predicted SnoaL-like aldol condensation-catalyzing enzyme
VPGDIHSHIRNFKAGVITCASHVDYVFSLVHITGISTGSSVGMPGKSFDLIAVDVVKFKDNKITDHWGFTDDATVEKNDGNAVENEWR